MNEEFFRCSLQRKTAVKIGAQKTAVLFLQTPECLLEKAFFHILRQFGKQQFDSQSVEFGK